MIFLVIIYEFEKLICFLCLGVEVILEIIILIFLVLRVFNKLLNDILMIFNFKLLFFVIFLVKLIFIFVYLVLLLIVCLNFIGV